MSKFLISAAILGISIILAIPEGGGRFGDVFSGVIIGIWLAVTVKDFADWLENA